MSLPLPVRRPLVVVLAVLTTLAASIAGAGTASAHVTVSSPDAEPGGYGKLTFRVPNESDTASTVSIRINIPQEAAMASLRAQPLPGWTVELTRSDLDQPVESHGREISSYVSVVEFRADDGGGIGPDQFQEFSLAGGPFPDAGTVSFPTVQVYSDGSEAAWIEPTVDGAAPERPAPVLALPAGGDSAPGEQEPAPAGTDPASAAGEGTANGSDALPLLLSALALLAGLAGVVLGWRAHRRTVAS